MTPIVFVFGKSGSGKTTFAEKLAQTWEVPEPSDRLKWIIGDLFLIPDEVLWGPASARNELDQRFTDVKYRLGCLYRFSTTYKAVCTQLFDRGNQDWFISDAQKAAEAQCREWFDIVMTKAWDPKSWGLAPRYLLQSFGTEFAQAVEQGVWNRHLKADVLKLQSGEYGYTGHALTYLPGSTHKYDLIVISGGRFPHDMEAARTMGATTILIEKPDLNPITIQDVGIRNHSSELGLDIIPRDFYNYIISNNSDLEALRLCADHVRKEILGL